MKEIDRSKAPIPPYKDGGGSIGKEPGPDLDYDWLPK